MVEPCDDGREPVEVLAEEFLERRRRGESPTQKEYLDHYPELAADIRELFPALILMDDIDPKSDELRRAGNGVAVPALKQLGDYQILRRIGGGGMGVVYEAEQLSLRRRVALKVLSSHALGDGIARDRFRREARSAARLHHTNIVPVFEVGQDGNVCYYAMQLIPGQSLDHVIRELRRLRERTTGRPGDTTHLATASSPEAGCQAALSLLTGIFEPAGEMTSGIGPPSPASTTSASHGSSPLSVTQAGHRPYYRSVARVGQQAALALAHAHARGIVHRDIKPSNLLLDESGVVWVTDFGLAKTEDEDLTNTGDFPGTLRYMSPERFDGHCDSQADVYGLGLTLYEMLVLAPAFPAGDRLQLLELIRNHEPPRPRDLDPRIPRDLETIVLKAIDKDRRRRYPSSDDLAEDLRRFLADEPIQARRARLPERLGRWCRRKPVLAGMVGVVVLLGLLLIAVGVGYNVRLSAALKQSDVNLRQAEKEGVRAGKAERERTAQLFDARFAAARASRFSRRPGQRVDSLNAIAAAAHLLPQLDLPEDKRTQRLQELRNLAIACLALPDLRPVEPLPESAADQARYFGQICYGETDDHGDLRLRRTADGADLMRVPAAGVPVRGIVSPDRGFLLAYTMDRPISLWQLSDPPRQLITFPAARASHAGSFFSDDSQRLVEVCQNGTAEVYDVPNGRLLQTLHVDPSFTASACCQTRLALANKDRKLVRIYDLAGGAKDESATIEGVSDVNDLAWLSYGQTLAIATFGGNILVYDASSGHRLREFMHQGGQPELGCLRTDDLLCSVSMWGGSVRLWNPRSGELLLNAPMVWNVTRPQAVAADRLLIWRHTNWDRTWQVEPSPVFRTLINHSTVGNRRICPRWGADGKLLAMAGADGVAIWDVEGGRELGQLPVGRCAIEFEPSGALLTNGPSGLLRWPVKTLEGSAAVWEIGPPRQLLPPSRGRQIETSRDGRVLAVSQTRRTVVLREDRLVQTLQLDPSDDIHFMAVSPDGERVATGGPSSGLVIWNSHTGERLRQEAIRVAYRIAISGDGRWLAASGDKLCLRRLDSWIPGPTLDAPYFEALAFSPNGRILALGTLEATVRLVDPDTGRDLARLEAPNQYHMSALAFSPDGTRLAATSNEGEAVFVWDLRRIRHELSALGLDWEAPPFLAAPPKQMGERPPSRLNVLGADLAIELRKRAELEKKRLELPSHK